VIVLRKEAIALDVVEIEASRLPVPRLRTLRAQLHDRMNYPRLALVWITKPPRSPRSFSPPRALRELRRLRRIVREKYFGLALPHTPDARTQVFKPSIELIARE